MEQISSYIRDPAWWFSAFFVAIIASLIAGFAKDRIERWTGSVSNLARERQAKRLAERAAAVDALAKNEAFLIMSLIRSAVLTVMWFSCVILFFLAPMFGQTLCVFLPNDPACGSGGKLITLFGSVLFGLLSIYASFKASSTVKTTMSGYRAFRKQRGFPPL